MQVESLTEPAAREVGAVRLQPQAYCQLHYLIARATREAAGLPSDLDMVDTSLHVEGISRASGASVDVPFMVHTPIANGRVFDRAGDGPIRVDTGRAGVRVAVRRHLARMFDGVEFTRMTPQLIGEQILTSLLAHVEVTIDALGDGGGPADAGPPR